MDTRTGNMLSSELMSILRESTPKHSAAEHELMFFKEMAVQPTARQLARGRVGRNDLCPCGSGKKFKHCCYYFQK